MSLLYHVQRLSELGGPILSTSESGTGTNAEASTRCLRVVHVIATLGRGGAEMVLHDLVTAAPSRRWDHVVITLGGEGPVGAMLKQVGIRVISLGLPRGPQLMLGWPRLFRELRQIQPDLVQTWMYHADLFGGTAGRLVGAPVVWGIHAGPAPSGMQGLKWKFARYALASVSRAVPRLIICCSHESLTVHRHVGYPPNKMVVIRNGFKELDVDRRATRERLLKDLSLDQDALLLVRVGRFHPQKDHATLLQAFEIIARQLPRAHLVLVGSGMNHSNIQLAAIAQDLRARVSPLGERDDTAKLVAGCDLAISSSAFGEAFPLVVGEAMVVGTPVVVTDVGDSRLLVGDDTRVVAPGSPSDLAAAALRVLRMSPPARRELGASDRHRVQELFSLSDMVSRYCEAYRKVARHRS